MLLRFAGVGIVNTLVGIACIVVCMSVLGLHPVVANVVGYVAGFVLGYVLNRRWTFADDTPARRSTPRYAAVVLGAYAISLTILSTAVGAGIDAYAAQVLAAAIHSSLVFFGARRYAFRRA